MEWLSTTNAKGSEAVIRGNFVENVVAEKDDNYQIQKILTDKNKLSEELQCYIFSGSNDFIGIEKYIHYGTQKWDTFKGGNV